MILKLINNTIWIILNICIQLEKIQNSMKNVAEIIEGCRCWFCWGMFCPVGFVILCRFLLWNYGGLFEILLCHWLNFTSPLAIFQTKTTALLFSDMVAFQVGSNCSKFPNPKHIRSQRSAQTSSQLSLVTH